jgi:hypothetical protein
MAAFTRSARPLQALPLGSRRLAQEWKIRMVIDQPKKVSDGRSFSGGILLGQAKVFTDQKDAGIDAMLYQELPFHLDHSRPSLGWGNSGKRQGVQNRDKREMTQSRGSGHRHTPSARPGRHYTR